MYATAIVDSVDIIEKQSPEQSATRVTLRFPQDGNPEFSAPIWFFEYHGNPQPSHVAGAILKIDLTDGDSLKRQAFEKISSFLPVLLPMAMNKLAGKNVVPTAPTTSLSGIFQTILGSFTLEQLSELEAQIAAEKARRPK